MVKITNPLGDVKIGRQGEVVYQRKYGEQIRRTVSPKSGIPSQAQIAHRQLCRAALAWRSQLSLANRRYLEGYCYANGVVDSYHIPLPWSRFALKIYLQSVKFLPTLTREFEPPKKELDQYYDTGDNGSSTIGFNESGAQTFTPSKSGLLKSVALKLWRDKNPHDIDIEIRTTDAGGLPTTTLLATLTFNTADLPTTGPASGKEYEFPSPTEVSQGVLYGLVLVRKDAGTNYKVKWQRDSTYSEYPDGQLCWSTDYGVTWTPYPNRDYMFKTYIEIPGYDRTFGLLHVKHPALLSVLQKRNGLTLKEYHTLSSLDEEYLTAQVGLDVESGDLIEATTLPGIEYTYQLR